MQGVLEVTRYGHENVTTKISPHFRFIFGSSMMVKKKKLFHCTAGPNFANKFCVGV
jgi:hypothetical protein